MTIIRKHPFLCFMVLCVAIGISLSVGVHVKHRRQHPNIVLTVQSKLMHNTLNFTGTIQPLRETSLVSPVSAVVESSHYHYGQKVAKGQVLFTLNSAEMQREFHDILTDYLKAKDSYDISLHKFTGTVDLWKAGLLSQNNYLTERSALNTTRVSLMQATRKLSEILEKIDQSEYDELSKLSFAEFDKVRLALTSKHNLIQIKAPRSGMLLAPPKASVENANLGTGSAVKAGQVLGLIGDMQGIRIEINIPEVDITELNIGTPAIVHGLAIRQKIMHGSIVAINAQATTGSGTSLPYFTAIVEVRHLSPELQSMLKVGMSASIQLRSQQAYKVLVPMDAVIQIAERTYVTKLDNNGIQQQIRVKTGAVHDDQVIIESGLNAGDRIVYRRFA